MKNNDIFSLKNQNLFGVKIYRTKDSVSTELDGETVILDISSGIYSGLDALGTFIWNQLDHPVTIAILRDRILEKYEVTEEQCVTDLISFLRELADNALIAIQNA